MILLHTTRQYVKTVKDYFFPYINSLKETRINNVLHFSHISEEYLSAIVINCILTEIEQLFTKKLINTTGPKIKFAFSDAQGIVLYKALLALPIPVDQYYLQKIRNEWVQLLDQQLIQNNLCQPVKKSGEYC